MRCIFCHSSSFRIYSYPKYSFNSKEFQYKRCTSCRLVQLFPLPQLDDYKVMYPSSYQEGSANTKILWQDGKSPPGLRFAYKKQFKLIEEYVSKSARILDYGCGNANFLVNARDYGFEYLEGVEFGEEIVSILSRQLENISFSSIDSIWSDSHTDTYDCIRLSNVLEHLSNPKEVLALLYSKLKPDGILLLEGPLEDNFYPMNMVNRIYFWITGMWNNNKVTTQPPYHIFFSNYLNQINVLEDAGYKSLVQEVVENSWPYPEYWSDAHGVKARLYYILSKLSRCLTSLGSKRWGNTILYIGKK